MGPGRVRRWGASSTAAGAVALVVVLVTVLVAPSSGSALVGSAPTLARAVRAPCAGTEPDPVPLAEPVTLVDDPVAGPVDVVQGPDGAVWFTNQRTRTVGRADASGALETVARIPVFGPQALPARPGPIVAGSDGAVWVGTSSPDGEYGSSAAVWRLAADGGLRSMADTRTAFSSLDGDGVYAGEIPALAAGPDGNVWAVVSGSPSGVLRIAPDGGVAEFPVTFPGGTAPEGMVAGPDGQLWVLLSSWSSPATTVLRLSTAGVVTSTATYPEIVDGTSIVAGADGNVWVDTASTGGADAGLARITPAGVVSLFTDPAVGVIQDVAAGSDGTVWFVEGLDGGLGWVTALGDVVRVADAVEAPVALAGTSDGSVWVLDDGSEDAVVRRQPDGTSTRLGGAGIGFPYQLAAGPEQVWFSDLEARGVGQVHGDGSVTMVSVPELGPRDIEVGADGELWLALGDAIGQLGADGDLTTYRDAAISSATWLAAGPDGNMWFTQEPGAPVGRITPAGEVTTYPSPLVTAAGPITAGGDGNLWFRHHPEGGDELVRMTPAGAVTVVALPPPSATWTDPVAQGPDGAVWFGRGGNPLKAGYVAPDGTVVAAVPAAIGPQEVKDVQDLTLGPDGDLWALTSVNWALAGGLHTTAELLHLSAAGVVGSIPLYGVWDAFRGAPGTDGQLWLTVDGGLGHLDVGAVADTAVTDAGGRPRLAVEDGPFVDVASDHPFCADIRWAAEAGITDGYPDGTFRPAAVVTRQAVAAFAYRSSGSPSFVPPASPTFSDVGPGHPFFTEIEWMAEVGIADGYPDGTFRPAAAVTRQAVAAFVFRSSGSPSFVPPASPTFSDVGPGHPFSTEIEWMAEVGIADGYPDGTFRPAAAVTRQAVVAFLHRRSLPSVAAGGAVAQAMP